jgi:hypothetical protein
MCGLALIVLCELGMELLDPTSIRFQLVIRCQTRL